MLRPINERVVREPKQGQKPLRGSWMCSLAILLSFVPEVWVPQHMGLIYGGNDSVGIYVRRPDPPAGAAHLPAHASALKEVFPPTSGRSKDLVPTK
jgi:hypothetical protein